MFGVVEPGGTPLGCEFLVAATDETRLDILVRFLTPQADGEASPREVGIGPVPLAPMRAEPVELSVEPAAPEVTKVSMSVWGSGPMVSTQAIVGVTVGSFVPPRDPPPALREAAEGCRSHGLWPVMAGQPGSKDLLLLSPIILEDYPQVAPESPTTPR
jgi:hypothetical protein